MIDHYTEDVPARVKAFTGGRGVHVVVEHVGQATWSRSLKSLARGGRLVTCGATTGHEGAIDLRFLFGRQLSLLGSYMGTKGELLRAAAFFFGGELAPVVDRTFPLAFLKAQIGAGTNLPESGLVFISIKDADKTADLAAAARDLVQMGFGIIATLFALRRGRH